MRLLSRLGSRKSDARRRPATARLRVQTLEDRALPTFGFGSAFSFGGTGAVGDKSIVVDAAGSIYVSGIFAKTVDFDPTDVNQTNSAAILTPTFATSDVFVAKYLANGTFQWATDIGQSDVSPFQLAVQGSNVYVPYIGLPSGVWHGYVSALDAGTGAVKWTTTFGANTQAWAVAVSPTGIVYADGFSTAADSHAIVDRLDPTTGNILWTQSSGGGLAAARQLAVDSAGNAYATGIYDPYGTSVYYGPTTFGSTALTESWDSDATFVWKLNSSGGTVWAGGMVGSGGADPTGIAVDGSGDVDVTGNWDGGSNNFNPDSGKAVSLPQPPNGSSDNFIVKLTPGKNGALSLGWAREFGGTGSISATAVAVDASGNVYTTGHFTGTVNFNPNGGAAQNLSGGGIFVSKLDTNGNYVAAADLAGTANGNGQGSAGGITLDGSGDVYTTGGFSGTVNFSPNGTYDLTDNAATGNAAFVLKLTQTSPQLAVSRGPGGPGVVPLTQSQLAAVEAVAINDWAAAGLPAADIAKMRSVSADATTLGGDNLGAAQLNGTEIAIDPTADGWGWSVDPTAQPATNRMDLLTVVMHELGHTIGLDSRFSGNPSDLMYAYLAPGERRLPGPADVPAGSTAIALLSEAPGPSDESIDWLSVAATLKPKSGLLADWLAAAGD